MKPDETYNEVPRDILAVLDASVEDLRQGRILNVKDLLDEMDREMAKMAQPFNRDFSR